MGGKGGRDLPAAGCCKSTADHPAADPSARVGVSSLGGAYGCVVSLVLSHASVLQGKHNAMLVGDITSPPSASHISRMDTKIQRERGLVRSNLKQALLACPPRLTRLAPNLERAWDVGVQADCLLLMVSNLLCLARVQNTVTKDKSTMAEAFSNCNKTPLVAADCFDTNVDE